MPLHRSQARAANGRHQWHPGHSCIGIRIAPRGAPCSSFLRTPESSALDPWGLRRSILASTEVPSGGGMPVWSTWQRTCIENPIDLPGTAETSVSRPLPIRQPHGGPGNPALRMSGKAHRFPSAASYSSDRAPIAVRPIVGGPRWPFDGNRDANPPAREWPGEHFGLPRGITLQPPFLRPK